MLPLQNCWTQREIQQLIQTPIQRTAPLPSKWSLNKATVRSDAIFTVSNINCNQYRRYATVKVDQQPINFQIDSSHGLPSTDPGQRAEISSNIADQTSNNRAKQLQRDYPPTFSDKPGLYKMWSATLWPRFVMPETLISDNGTQFISAESKNFCLENGIQHIFSPPYHPRSNG
ncbi:hypothetical protein Aduo_012746 [Ancylostoma duodenale]